MMAKIRILPQIVILLTIVLQAGCDKQVNANMMAAGNTCLNNQTLANYQGKLLDFAFESATAIPVKPHIKDRSRAQEAVVQASLELNQPERGLQYLEKIDNWRRGVAYGDLAFYCARKGKTNEVPQYLNLATQLSEIAEDWRKDTIKVKIAQVHTLMGDNEAAKKIEGTVDASQQGKVDHVKAMLSAEEEFEEQVKTLDTLINSGNFDTVKNALKAYAQLFNRFYGNEDQRKLIIQKIKDSWSSMPLFIRIELLVELAGFTLEHNDQVKALEFINEAQKIRDEAEWPLENSLQLSALLAEIRYRAGDIIKARADADAALQLFDKHKDQIVNIYRAGAIRPLAEAYQAMGDTQTALEVYKRALNESVENPNSRPRAEDLSATCLSMAKHQVEPDEETWNKIHQIKKQLADPW